MGWHNDSYWDARWSCDEQMGLGLEDRPNDAICPACGARAYDDSIEICDCCNYGKDE